MPRAAWAAVAALSGVRHGAAAREAGLHAIGQALHVRVEDAVRLERGLRLEQVLRAGAVAAARRGDRLHHRRDGKPARVTRAGAVHDEGEHGEALASRMAVDPARVVGTQRHLAPPEGAQFVARGRLREPEGEAAAAAAAFQREHQAGAFRRAAIGARPQAEVAVEPVDRADALRDEREAGIPHEGAVGEDPQRLARAPAGQDRIQGTVQRLLRESLGGDGGRVQAAGGATHCYGERREIFQPCACLVYAMRSCSRLWRPCQNSSQSGITR